MGFLAYLRSRLLGRQPVRATPETGSVQDERLSSQPAFPQFASRAWREGTITRAEELKALSRWAQANGSKGNPRHLRDALLMHLDAAISAAHRRFQLTGNGSTIQRAMGNLDAAEANLLSFAPASYLLGQMPSILNHVQRHLSSVDPRRLELQRIAQKAGIEGANHPPLQDYGQPDLANNISHEERERENLETVDRERRKIVAAARGASSAALRERLRVASFRNVLVAATVVLTLLAMGVAILGFLYPVVIPLCFESQTSGATVVVCPTARSGITSQGQGIPSNPTPEQIDTTIQRTAKPHDLLVVELIGLTAASVASAAAIRNMRGSSEPYGLPVALALLKMPTGAITAFLGLLLMRGGFIPGLSALDTPAQILAWAILFGYAQQLFTRFIDQQASAVLDTVRGGDKKRDAAQRT